MTGSSAFGGADTFDGGTGQDGLSYIRSGEVTGKSRHPDPPPAAKPRVTPSAASRTSRVLSGTTTSLGDEAANHLYAGTGNDTLIGGAGRDVLRGDDVERDDVPKAPSLEYEPLDDYELFEVFYDDDELLGGGRQRYARRR